MALEVVPRGSGLGRVKDDYFFHGGGSGSCIGSACDLFMDGNEELEEGEAREAPTLDVDLDFPHLDVKLSEVLGDAQKDFEGLVFSEKLGSKYGHYGTFLPTEARLPSVLLQIKQAEAPFCGQNKQTVAVSRDSTQTAALDASPENLSPLSMIKMMEMMEHQIPTGGLLSPLLSFAPASISLSLNSNEASGKIGGEQYRYGRNDADARKLDCLKKSETASKFRLEHQKNSIEITNVPKDKIRVQLVPSKAPKAPPSSEANAVVDDLIKDVSKGSTFMPDAEKSGVSKREADSGLLVFRKNCSNKEYGIEKSENMSTTRKEARDSSLGKELRNPQVDNTVERIEVAGVFRKERDSGSNKEVKSTKATVLPVGMQGDEKAENTDGVRREIRDSGLSKEPKGTDRKFFLPNVVKREDNDQKPSKDKKKDSGTMNERRTDSADGKRLKDSGKKRHKVSSKAVSDGRNNFYKDENCQLPKEPVKPVPKDFGRQAFPDACYEEKQIKHMHVSKEIFTDGIKSKLDEGSTMGKQFEQKVVLEGDEPGLESVRLSFKDSYKESVKKGIKEGKKEHHMKLLKKDSILKVDRKHDSKSQKAQRPGNIPCQYSKSETKAPSTTLLQPNTLPEGDVIMPVAQRIVLDNWAQCDACEQWRLLPPDVKPEDLAKRWLCKMITWLPGGMNSCSFTEDETTNAVYSSLGILHPPTEALQPTIAPVPVLPPVIPPSDLLADVNIATTSNGSKKGLMWKVEDVPAPKQLGLTQEIMQHRHKPKKQASGWTDPASSQREHHLEEKDIDIGSGMNSEDQMMEKAKKKNRKSSEGDLPTNKKKKKLEGRKPYNAFEDPLNEACLSAFVKEQSEGRKSIDMTSRVPSKGRDPQMADVDAVENRIREKVDQRRHGGGIQETCGKVKSGSKELWIEQSSPSLPDFISKELNRPAEKRRGENNLEERPLKKPKYGKPTGHDTSTNLDGKQAPTKGKVIRISASLENRRDDFEKKTSSTGKKPSQANMVDAMRFLPHDKSSSQGSSPRRQQTKILDVPQRGDSRHLLAPACSSSQPSPFESIHGGPISPNGSTHYMDDRPNSSDRDSAHNCFGNGDAKETDYGTDTWSNYGDGGRKEDRHVSGLPDEDDLDDRFHESHSNKYHPRDGYCDRDIGKHSSEFGNWLEDHIERGKESRDSRERISSDYRRPFLDDGHGEQKPWQDTTNKTVLTNGKKGRHEVRHESGDKKLKTVVEHHRDLGAYSNKEKVDLQRQSSKHDAWSDDMGRSKKSMKQAIEVTHRSRDNIELAISKKETQKQPKDLRKSDYNPLPGYAGSDADAIVTRNEHTNASFLAENAIKAAKNLKHTADRLKVTDGTQKTDVYLQAALKFLQGAALLEKVQPENSRQGDSTQSMTLYNETANLCKFCASAYEKAKDMAAAALAYKCAAVARMRVLQAKNAAMSRDRMELQAATQPLLVTNPQAPSPLGHSPSSSSASDVDNANHCTGAKSLPNSSGRSTSPLAQIQISSFVPAALQSTYSRLLRNVSDTCEALEDWGKADSAIMAAARIVDSSDAPLSPEAMAAVEKVGSVGFSNVEALVQLVNLAMTALGR